MSEKYSFIDAEKAHYPVVKMCVWLQVSTSGFYAWRDRPASATARRRARLAGLVQAIFEASDGTYGYRRIHAALLRQGEDCGPELVRDLVRELERENRELRMKTEFLGKAAAFFAQEYR